MLKAVTKGKNGEKELSNILSTHLGYEIIVNPYDNQADIRSIPGLAIEVKRCEKLQLDKWWKQTLIQAENINAIPVLAYRQNRKPWHVCLPAKLIVTRNKNDYLIVTIAVFLEWLDLFVE